MAFRRAFTSALHFFVVFALFSLGLFFASLAHLPEARVHLAHFLLNRFEVFIPIGLGFFLVSLFFLISFYGLNRGRYLSLKMGEHLAAVDLVLVRDLLDDYLKAHFSPPIALEEVEISQGKKLQIAVRLSSLEEKTRDPLFSSVEKHLQTLLRERFGYTRPFFLIVRSR